MADLKVYNQDGKETDTIKLPKEVFTDEVNASLMHQVVTMYRANLRQGNASTKTRKQVSGGGKKPFRQKGTGRARAGSTRSPLWKGGGVVFGPNKRDFSYTLPSKIKRQALRESLKSKVKAEDVVCVSELKIDSGKTKDFAKVLGNFKINSKVLTLLDGSDSKVTLASRNIKGVHVQRAEDVNAFDMLNNKKILVTRQGFEKLLERIS